MILNKKCCSCKVNKDKTLFHKNKWQEDGYHHTCKDCRKSQSKTYHIKNRDVLNDKSKKYYEDNKELALEKARVYYENNKEKVLNNVHNYYNNNKSKVLALSRKKRIRKELRTPKWLTREDFLIMESFYIEAQIATDLSGEIYHVDHIIPLKGQNVSGLHVPSNLQVITAKENLAKSNKFVI